MRCLLLSLVIMLVSAGSAYAQVGLDVFNTGATGTGTLSWTHTPTGTPRGVLVACTLQSTESNQISGVTYGGVAMTANANNPVHITDGTDTGAVDVFFLGASIPTGAQTVAVSVSGAASKACSSVTLTATTDTEVVTSATYTNTTASSPNSAVIALTGRTSFVALGFYTGVAGATSIDPSAGWTAQLENDFGPAIGGVYTYDTIGSTDVTAGASQNGAVLAYLAVAVSEQVAGGGGTTHNNLLLLGVGQ